MIATQDTDTIAHLAQADLLLWLASWLRPPGAARDALPSTHELFALLAAAGLRETPQLAERVTALHEAIAATDVDAQRHEHHRLFDAGIACPINETAYVRRDKGAILGDVAGFYNAFGFTTREGVGDKPDHLACQLEYVAMLLMLIAQAQQAGEPDNAELTRKALASFAGDHVDAWVGLFCARLRDTTRLRLHAALADAIETTWHALVERHGLPRAEGVAAGAPREEPETPYACGMADAEGVAGSGDVEVRVGGQPVP